MRITILGVGNRYAVDLLPATYVIEAGSAVVLVNCGYGAVKEAYLYGFLPRITHVVLNSFEAYNAGELAHLGLRCRYLTRSTPYLLFPPQRAKPGPVYTGIDGNKPLLDFFKPATCLSNQALIGTTLDVLAFPTVAEHAAYFIGDTATKKSVLITGECPGPSKQLVKLPYEQASVILHSCAFEGERKNASYDEIAKIPRTGALYLTEYRDRDAITGSVGTLELAVPGMVLEL